MPRNTSTILLGDFNRHHPAWDDPRNKHLLTDKYVEAAKPLVQLVEERLLKMALPKFTPTHEHLVLKKLSRLDNVFVSDSLYDHLIECKAYPDRRPVSTDHFPIVTKLDLTLEKAKETLRRSFTNTNWEKFNKLLTEKLKMLLTEVIETIAEFDARLDALTKAILDTIEAVVPYARITSYCKRWWTKELSKLRAQRFNLGYRASRREDTPKDPIHQELKLASKLYKLALKNTKAKCWNDFINTAEAKALWNAYKWMRGQEENAGNAQIPTLRATAPNGSTTLFSTNEEKSAALYQTFFPTPPPIDVPTHAYPDEIKEFQPITEKEIFEVIRELKPNKAPGPDGIPNCVFVNNAVALVPHPLPIYQATFRRPDYTVTKAYRPIALLNVISKILSACVANRLNTIVETHDLLPAHHFGGRAGCTTTDSMHLLHKFVKDAWRRKKVVAGLFLDVTGAFPNASPAMLTHNMQKLGIPSAIVNWTARKLEGRGTTMKFDDFESEPDLIKVAQSTRGELAVGYIDDVAFLAEGVDFTQANAKLKRMMERKGGALEWARTHTLDFALEKTALVQFNRYLRVDPRPVTIGGVEVKPEPSHKFLGVIFDAKLTWGEQRLAVLRKATKWAHMVKRVCHVRNGLKPLSARRLHDSVFIAKVTYAADIWWEPTGKKGQGKKRTGAVGFTKHLQSAQRIVALAITGALRTAPTDTVLAHAGIFPIKLELRRASHRAAVRLAGIPLTHPLRAKINAETKTLKKSKTHHSTIRKLLLLNPYVAPGGTDEAIADESTLKPTVKIFSDGSMVGGNVGAAAVLIREGKEEVVTRKYVGLDREHEVYEAEVVGLILGLELLARERGAGEAIFFIDNQAVLLTLKAGHTDKLGYLYAHMDEGIRLAREANPGVKLKARWIPGHKGVDGNKRADVEAKLAATPGNNTNTLLPGPLKKAIPVNPTAAKRERKARMEGEWADWIEDEGNPRQTQALQLIDDTYPSMNFKKAADSLTRMEYATLTQLRTGHYPTSTYLFRTTLADSPRCPHCESQNKNVFHLLIGCKATKGYRQERDQAMGAASRSVNLLLKPGEHTKHLMEYLRKVRGLSGGAGTARG
ncbi:Reverse transcriptase (RNA-dependent DNA polymerase) [Rhizoctonia solani]|uniref:Reverse transcriptase (RNA-dependent DNA polymerase) n=1 Tax=Rhizoctonia solani TaxID=456999 RepID=A0A8H7LG82_9AGAM|nr:Reverse transcriptase (RNA-dependent DNA polymerase) [Rhizoctonia solani]